ncbi:MAG: hypothetical protein LBL34_07090 [Clostridiales bacterium]|jgi:hypothetical protein|nr:hypothetical protein [Clostridiales bacterium]
MGSLEKLIEICNQYKKGQFEIEEFQSRIVTALTPENISKECVEELRRFDNDIEKIIYCQLPISWRSMGEKVADRLILALQGRKLK